VGSRVAVYWQCTARTATRDEGEVGEHDGVTAGVRWSAAPAVSQYDDASARHVHTARPSLISCAAHAAPRGARALPALIKTPNVTAQQCHRRNDSARLATTTTAKGLRGCRPAILATDLL